MSSPVTKEDTRRRIELRRALFLALIHTAVSFASFFLTTPVERRLNTALPGADSTEMMQDYPLHVLEIHAEHFAALALKGVAPRNYRKNPKSAQAKDLQHKIAA